jgi:urease accessory protein
VWLAVDARVRDGWGDLDRLDAELHALRPASTTRAANRAMGGRLLKTWQEIHPNGCVTRPDDSASDRRPSVFCLPIAFGIVCGSIGVESRTAVSAFIYTRLASLVSSAMRLMSIGQRDAHRLLAAALARVPSVVDGIDDRVSRGMRPGAFAPALDIAAIGQQYVHSRLFLS